MLCVTQLLKQSSKKLLHFTEKGALLLVHPPNGSACAPSKLLDVHPVRARVLYGKVGQSNILLGKGANAGTVGKDSQKRQWPSDKQQLPLVRAMNVLCFLVQWYCATGSLNAGPVVGLITGVMIIVEK